MNSIVETWKTLDPINAHNHACAHHVKMKLSPRFPSLALSSARGQAYKSWEAGKSFRFGGVGWIKVLAIAPCPRFSIRVDFPSPFPTFPSSRMFYPRSSPISVYGIARCRAGSKRRILFSNIIPVTRMPCYTVAFACKLEYVKRVHELRM